MPVRVVNMIPKSMSGEFERDAEPSVSVNPADPQQIAAMAFTPDPAQSGSAPIYVSTDGGATWALNVCLPGGDTTADQSLRFGSGSGVLYAGIIRADDGNLNILRTASYTTGAMTVLVDRASDDQPWVEAATDAGTDRVYVSSNDRSNIPITASVDFSLDAATAAPPANFQTARLEVRTNAGGDGPSVRTAVHANGTVYAVFFRWTSLGPSSNQADVVVVRDDSWAGGAAPFTALVDMGDGNAGVRVRSVQIAPTWTLLGNQRIGSQLAIAVDPTDSQTVYIAWCDGTTAAAYTLHVLRSVDGGQTWSPDLQTITSATNPGLAITSEGTVGLLFQQLVSTGTGDRWHTHLLYPSNGFATAPIDHTLADVPDMLGPYQDVNPLGDFTNLIAVGVFFYGVFSAFNTPDHANFPNGVHYQRNADFKTHTLLATDGVTPVPASIDPFFFSTYLYRFPPRFHIPKLTPPRRLPGPIIIGDPAPFDLNRLAKMFPELRILDQPAAIVADELSLVLAESEDMTREQLESTREQIKARQARLGAALKHLDARLSARKKKKQ
jgi:hypothetical protein